MESQFKVYPSPDGTWNATIYGLSPDDVGDLLETFNMVKEREDKAEEKEFFQ